MSADLPEPLVPADVARFCRACARRARFLWRCIAWRNVGAARWSFEYETAEDAER